MISFILGLQLWSEFMDSNWVIAQMSGRKRNGMISSKDYQRYQFLFRWNVPSIPAGAASPPIWRRLWVCFSFHSISVLECLSFFLYNMKQFYFFDSIPVQNVQGPSCLFWFFLTQVHAELDWRSGLKIADYFQWKGVIVLINCELMCYIPILVTFTQCIISAPEFTRALDLNY